MISEVLFQKRVLMWWIFCTRTLYPKIKRSGTGFQSKWILVNVTLLVLSPVGLETKTKASKKSSYTIIKN